MSAPAHLTHIGLRRAICGAKLIIFFGMNKNDFTQFHSSTARKSRVESNSKCKISKSV